MYNLEQFIVCCFFLCFTRNNTYSVNSLNILSRVVAHFLRIRRIEMLSSVVIAALVAVAAASFTYTCTCTGATFTTLLGVDTCATFIQGCKDLATASSADAGYSCSDSSQYATCELTTTSSQYACSTNNLNSFGVGCQALCLIGQTTTGTASCASNPACFPANATVQLQVWAINEIIYNNPVLLHCMGLCDASCQLTPSSSQNGAHKTMAELQVGDRVMVAPGVFSEIYMFSHRYVDAVAPFVKITTATTELLITADHYLYINGALAVASTIKACETRDHYTCVDPLIIIIMTAMVSGW